MINLIRGIKRIPLKTVMEKIWTITCDTGYVLAMLIWLIIIPLALLFRAVTEIRAALRTGKCLFDVPACSSSTPVRRK